MNIFSLNELDPEGLRKQEEKIRQLPSLSLDPLSLAFITYASLEVNNPLKDSAKEIIDLLYTFLPDPNTKYHHTLNFIPSDFAFSFGIAEEVGFLDLSQPADREPKILILHNGEKWVLNWEDYAEQQGFLKLAQALSLQTETQEENLPETLERAGEETVNKIRIQVLKPSPKQQTSQDQPKKTSGAFSQRKTSPSSSCKKHFLN